MKVAAYCRVSTELDDQQNSLKNQKEYFTSFIQARSGESWEFAGIYADEGISGTSMNKREAFLRMMADAREGKIDLILTKEVSRFARNTVDTLIAVRRLRTWGVGVFFIIDHIDTRENDGEIRLTLMASMAQEESRKISERVKWGQKRQMERGVVFGRRLFGYELEHGVLAVNEKEAKIVREIFLKYVVEGKGTGTIAKELNEAGEKTSRGNPWSHVAVRRILQNEKYIGNLVQKKTYTPDYLTHKKKKNCGQEEFVIKTFHHEPIVSRELFERAQKRLWSKRTEENLEGENGNSRENERGKYRKRYWCSGKVVCGICGSRYVSRIRYRADGSIRHSWLCEKAVREGRKKQEFTGEGEIRGCNAKSISDEVLWQGYLAAGGKVKEKTEELKEIRVLKGELVYKMASGETWVYRDAGRYRGTGTSGNCGSHCASADQKSDTGGN